MNIDVIWYNSLVQLVPQIFLFTILWGYAKYPFGLRCPQEKKKKKHFKRNRLHLAQMNLRMK